MKILPTHVGILTGVLVVFLPAVHVFAASCTPPPTQVEGFFSSDKSFIVDGKNNGTDLSLHIGGAVTINAALGSGTFQLNRDFGSANNKLNPIFTIAERPDMILNSPELLKARYYLYRELAP